MLLRARCVHADASTSHARRLPDAARDACTLLTPPSNSTVTYTLYKQGCPSGYGAHRHPRARAPRDLR